MNELTVRDGCLLFWGGWPSNWFRSEFTLGGVHYNCMEQYMMAEKALTFGDEEVRQKILASPFPKAQKEFGRKVRGYNDAFWSAVRYDIVRTGSIEKYGQNPDLKKLLLDSGSLTLVEASPYDCIWGIGLSQEHPDAATPSRWRGENLLGKVLGEVRDYWNQFKG